jgi:ArsR family transcriptional regulator
MMHHTVKLFKALSEEVRLRILGLLMHGELCVCDLMAVLDLPQSTISRHLSYLANAGWLAGERRGVWMYYKLAEPTTELHRGLITLLNSCLPQIPQTKDDLTALARRKNTQDDTKC